MREIIKQAATVDEAVQLALRELGLSREQVTYEVLEYPEKGFLFFKGKPAKVKVMELEEDLDIKSLFEEKKPAAEEKPAKPAKKAEKPEKPAKQETKKTEKPAPKAEKPAKQEQVKEEVKEQPKTEPSNDGEEVLLETAPAKVKYAIEFIESVIGQFYQGAHSFKIFKTQTGFIIKIVGEDAGCLIGRKGETMEALSYLTSLAANRFEDSDEKISVDVADYRQKREKDLVVLAKKMAAKVAKSGRSYSFEPMNPYERRIIHATVGEIDGVKSESKGEGSQRRVVIYPTTPRRNNHKGDRRDNRKGGNGSRRNDRREKPAPQVQKTRETKLVDDFGGSSLYGKIEL